MYKNGTQALPILERAMLKTTFLKKKNFLFVPVVIFTMILCSMGIAEDKTSYHGNLKSKVFHTIDCRYYNCKQCTVDFSSREEAIDSGYRACKICKP